MACDRFEAIIAFRINLCADENYIAFMSGIIDTHISCSMCVQVFFSNINFLNIELNQNYKYLLWTDVLGNDITQQVLFKCLIFFLASRMS